MHINTDDLISSVCFRFLSFYFLSQFRFNIPQSTSHQLLLTRLANTVIFKIAASEVPLKWYRLAWEAVCLSWFLFSRQAMKRTRKHLELMCICAFSKQIYCPLIKTLVIERHNVIFASNMALYLHLE